MTARNIGVAFLIVLALGVVGALVYSIITFMMQLPVAVQYLGLGIVFALLLLWFFNKLAISQLSAYTELVLTIIRQDDEDELAKLKASKMTIHNHPTPSLLPPGGQESLPWNVSVPSPSAATMPIGSRGDIVIE